MREIEIPLPRSADGRLVGKIVEEYGPTHRAYMARDRHPADRIPSSDDSSAAEKG